MCHQHHPYLCPQILKLVNLCKCPDGVNLLHVIHDLAVVVVVLLDKDPCVRLIQLNLPSHYVHQSAVSDLYDLDKLGEYGVSVNGNNRDYRPYIGNSLRGGNIGDTARVTGGFVLSTNDLKNGKYFFF